MSMLDETGLLAFPTDEETVRKNDMAHVLHSWAAQGHIDAVPIAGGEGAWFWDPNGRRYLDFSSQLVNVNIGYQHPRLVAAVQEQAGRMVTVSPAFANDARSEAARLIAELAPGDLDMVFFTSGGAEANEMAIRMARVHSGRHKILSAYRSYHGSTAGASALTGEPRRWATEPGMPGVARFWGPNLYRSPFHATTEQEECERALQHLRDTIVAEGSHTVAAVILETVVGTNGILVPPDGYLAGVRERRAVRGGTTHRGPSAWRPRHGLLHQRRRRGQRDGHPDGAGALRPAQDPGRLPQLPRVDSRSLGTDR